MDVVHNAAQPLCMAPRCTAPEKKSWEKHRHSQREKATFEGREACEARGVCATRGGSRMAVGICAQNGPRYGDVVGRSLFMARRDQTEPRGGGRRRRRKTTATTTRRVCTVRPPVAGRPRLVLTLWIPARPPSTARRQATDWAD